MYQLQDFCQGHSATTCPGCFDPDFGCDGHGVRSFCDGTCAEALENYTHYLRHDLRTSPVAPYDTITLDVYGAGVSYRVTFEGPDAQAWALAYRAARPELHVTIPEHLPLHARFGDLWDVQHPQCHHGMAADLCMDPYGDAHFGTREQEMSWEI
jgi:hypothetical protein